MGRDRLSNTNIAFMLNQPLFLIFRPNDDLDGLMSEPEHQRNNWSWRATHPCSGLAGLLLSSECALAIPIQHSTSIWEGACQRGSRTVEPEQVLSAAMPKFK